MPTQVPVKRLRIQELMDEPGLDLEAHRHALRSLERINRLTGARRNMRRTIERKVPQAASFLDLGAGDGSLLSWLRQCGGTFSNSLRVCLDRSVQALRIGHAHRTAGDSLPLAADVRLLPLADGSIDVVLCSLLLHHLEAEDAIRLFQEAARVSRRAVIVSDLTRSQASWIITWLATRVLSCSRVVHVDGPRSVRAAFTIPEAKALVAAAGMQGVTIESQFPFRMMLVWIKPQTWRAEWPAM